MRNIEKGLLLAESFGADTSKYIPSFIEWIKNTPQYKRFLDNRNKLKTKEDFQAKKVLKKYNQINIDSITSIKEGLIIFGRINYLLKISDEEFYTNPLLVYYLDNKNLTIGEIKVICDNNKLISLNELSKSREIVSLTKENIIEQNVNLWMDEIRREIVLPFEKITQKNLYLPKRPFFKFSRVLEIIYFIIINTLIIYSFFCNVEIIKNILLGNSNVFLCIIYDMLISLVFVYDCIFIGSSIYNIIIYREYRKKSKFLNLNITKVASETENKLKEYLIDHISKHEEMNKKVIEFNDISKYYDEIFYFKKRMEQKKIISKDYLSIGEKIGILITFIFLMILVISLLVVGGIV